MNETIKERQQKEVDDNYKYFKSLAKEEIQDHVGKYALLQKRSIVAYFTTYRDALYAGRILAKNDKNDDVFFSIQKVEDSIQHLGWFSSIDNKK